MARRTIVAAIITIAGIVLAGIAVWMQRPRLELVELSQQTTYITQPTRADGWVDYAGAVDWIRRASLDAGGTNAADPLLRALGHIGIPSTSGANAPADDATTRVGDWLRARCPARGNKRIAPAEIFDWLTKSGEPLSNLHAAA